MTPDEPTPTDPTPQGDAPPPVVDGDNAPGGVDRDVDIDAQPPGAYVDEEDGPIPEPNEPG